MTERPLTTSDVNKLGRVIDAWFLERHGKRVGFSLVVHTDPRCCLSNLTKRAQAEILHELMESLNDGVKNE